MPLTFWWLIRAKLGERKKKGRERKKKSISLALRILPRWILYRLYFKPRAGIRLLKRNGKQNYTHYIVMNVCMLCWTASSCVPFTLAFWHAYFIYTLYFILTMAVYSFSIRNILHNGWKSGLHHGMTDRAVKNFNEYSSSAALRSIKNHFIVYTFRRDSIDDRRPNFLPNFENPPSWTSSLSLSLFFFPKESDKQTRKISKRAISNSSSTCAKLPPSFFFPLKRETRRLRLPPKKSKLFPTDRTIVTRLIISWPTLAERINYAGSPWGGDNSIVIG